jgi:uncharacterized protein (TIGR03083 family)
MNGLSNTKDKVVGALTDEWRQIGELMAPLSDAQWHTSSILPGWTVSDILAHVIGTECMLSGETAPPAKRDLKESEHVRNDIAAMNEQWVDSMRELSPPEVLARFAEITTARTLALESMTEDEFDAPSWTPAGQATYGRFMQIRVYDCWLHEQDIRDTLGIAGNESGIPANIAIDELSLSLGYIIGKKAGAPDGSSVTLEIEGGVPRTFHVSVAGRATLVDHLDAPATATLHLTSGQLFHLAGGRVDPAGLVDDLIIDGDRDLGRRVVLALPFTI